MVPDGNKIFDVFLIPSSTLDERTERISIEAMGAGLQELENIGRALADNLRSVIRTLTIPFHYTQAEFQSLHWQRIYAAERIRSLKSSELDRSDEQTLAKARETFQQFIKSESSTTISDQIVERLLDLSKDEQSLLAARELTRQGIVLTWSAVEVFCRDSFIYLLNRRPILSQRLLADAGNKRRFSADRVDWQTLESYGYDLSGSLGTLLAERADLSNVPAIRSAYGALFPSASELQSTLGNSVLWLMSQKRHLLVHKRGIVDRQYIDATNSTIPVGNPLWVKPDEVEASIAIAIDLGVLLSKAIVEAMEASD